jgi:exodeoxyribonuclease V
MEWAPEQDAALKAVDRWLHEPENQVFRLFGYAGTGKTTLAKHFAENIDGTVLFGAYTGKAAHVLRQKGCVGATTIHQMIYTSREKSAAFLRTLEAELGQLLAELRNEYKHELPDNQQQLIDADIGVMNLRAKIKLEREAQTQPMFTLNREKSPVNEASLVVIDECSMVDGQMGMDLLSFGVPVLVLGDPAQLPPVGGAGFFTENVTPDVMLQDIHRQAKDNPIIAMATEIRNQRKLQAGTYGDSLVLEAGVKISPEEALDADQILVGRNKTRAAVNARTRTLLGYRNEEGDRPVSGDRLVCLRNNHDLGLLNGAIWYVKDCGGLTQDDRITLTVTPEDGGSDLTTECHMQHFVGKSDEIAWFERKEAQEFDYGYALTVHKSQGSQWQNVLLFDESFCFRADRWRWLYTGITRAAQRVTIVES